jgi:metal-dependent amidase/aminoacylase/carboxypeptidase family protein
VLTFGAIAAGDAANVIPSIATASGSIRTMNTIDRAFLHEELPRVAQAVAGAHGCRATVTITKGEPILVNDEQIAAGVRSTLKCGGDPAVEPMRSCGADDFSFYAERVPSLMMFVGVEGIGGRELPALHSPHFLPDERSIEDVVRAVVIALDAAAGVMAQAVRA